MLPKARTFLVFFLALVFLAGHLGAQAFGRATLVVNYPDGSPAKGVKVVAMSESLSSYSQEKKTDKKGKVILTFVDATKLYQIRVEMEGYEPLEFDLKPEVRGNVTRELTLEEPGAGQAEAPPVVGKLKPAEEAFNTGLEALRSGDKGTAKTKFEEAIALDPKLAIAHSGLAGIQLDENDYAGAVATAEKVLELAPDDIRAYGVLYDAHTALGNKKEAKAALDKMEALGAGSDSAALVFNQGVAAFQVGDAATAEAKFREALEHDPELVPAMSALATVYVQLQRYPEAIEMTERQLTYEPDNVNALRRRWEAYQVLGETDKASEAFQALAAQQPEVLADELFDQGVELFEGGDAGAAKEIFERVLEIQPDRPRAHYRLGLCHLGAGENADAKEHLQRFLELAPNDPEAGAAQEMLSYVQ